MEDARTVTVRIPLVFKKHGGRKAVISPDGHVWEPSEPLVDRALVKALGRAFRWQRLLDDGTYGTFDDLAKAEGISQSYISRVLRLTLLAPSIVETILDGRQAEGLRLEELVDAHFLDWEEQRRLAERADDGGGHNHGSRHLRAAGRQRQRAVGERLSGRPHRS